jgi:hypothetical protein
MKHIIFSAWIIALFILIQGCTTTRRFGTTVEKDENNPCLINMVIQIGVQGTDADVQKVRTDLEACYGKECFIPCEPDNGKGCKTKITVVVRKWASLSEDEQQGFHYIQMVDDDGLPSNAYIGTPNSGTSSGTWRRNAHPKTYCHEVLHLCGLDDQYCSRLYDPVTNTTVTELTCNPPPDPNGGSCCSPTISNKRCSNPCSGHEHDLMASLEPELSCDNIKDVLKLAGFSKCPQECCSSSTAFQKPPDELYIMPGYLHFGDKSTKFSSIGGAVGYTKYISPSVGLTLDAGYYTHTEKDNSFKETSGLLNITAGITYLPGNQLKSHSGFTVSTHAMASISSYMQKSTYAGNSYSNNDVSFHFNVGAALNMKLNQSLGIRLLQADYAPTFFYNTTQHNFRLSAGIFYYIPRH